MDFEIWLWKMEMGFACRWLRSKLYITSVINSKDSHIPYGFEECFKKSIGTI